MRWPRRKVQWLSSDMLVFLVYVVIKQMQRWNISFEDTCGDTQRDLRLVFEVRKDQLLPPDPLKFQDFRLGTLDFGLGLSMFSPGIPDSCQQWCTDKCPPPPGVPGHTGYTDQQPDPAWRDTRRSETENVWSKYYTWVRPAWRSEQKSVRFSVQNSWNEDLVSWPDRRRRWW